MMKSKNKMKLDFKNIISKEGLIQGQSQLLIIKLP